MSSVLSPQLSSSLLLPSLSSSVSSVSAWESFDREAGYTAAIALIKKLGWRSLWLVADNQVNAEEMEARAREEGICVVKRMKAR